MPDTTTCAVIVILTECTPQLSEQLAMGELDAAWHGCLEILGRMSNGHSLAGQYIHSIKTLRDRTQVLSGMTALECSIPITAPR